MSSGFEIGNWSSDYGLPDEDKDYEQACYDAYYAYCEYMQKQEENKKEDSKKISLMK